MDDNWEKHWELEFLYRKIWGNITLSVSGIPGEGDPPESTEGDLTPEQKRILEQMEQMITEAVWKVLDRFDGLKVTN